MLRSLRGLVRHWRQGTLQEAIRRRQGQLPTDIKVHWEGTDSVSEAALGLALYARKLWQPPHQDKTFAIVGDPGPLVDELSLRLQRMGVPAHHYAVEQLLQQPAQDTLAVLCAQRATADIGHCAAALMAHREWREVPFEYVAGLDPAEQQFRRLDEYADTFFVSPVLTDDIPVYQIYQQSLTLFEQKCGLRDYLDLYQLLRYLHQRQVPGDICEFGSFRGHSGWLIASLLQAMGSEKRIYLFDTFENFPKENLGIDDYWSETHQVDFDEVKGKFAQLPQVEFVRGDFTETCLTHGPDQIALAYVDCDSYRATHALHEKLWESRLSQFGIMAFEDYGHPALLGNRLAVNEHVRNAAPGFEFFSQFSGIYAKLKL